MDQNFILLFGYELRPVHFSAGMFILALAGSIVGTFIMARFKRWMSDRGGSRQFDHYLDALTYASEPDERGYRTVILRNLGMPMRAEYVLRGNRVRGWLMAAAQMCDYDIRRFVKDPNPDRQAAIVEIVRSALSRHFERGEIAHLSKLPTRKFDLYYAVTGADAAQGGVRKIRVMIADEETLRIFHDHPEDKWDVEANKVTGVKQKDHIVRVKTIRQMADALFNHKGCRMMDNNPTLIVGWMEAREPCRPEEAN